MAWHRQFWVKVAPPSEQAVRCIMDAAPFLPEGLAELMAVDPDPHPQPGELWRVGRSEAVLVWVRKILPDGVADVIAVTMEVEMADTSSLLVSATSTPFQTPLAVLTVVRTHLPWAVFLSRICALGVADDVEEVIDADRAGRLPTGCWVGPPITDDDDPRIAFRQQLMSLLVSWAPSPVEDFQPRSEPHPTQADLTAALAVAEQVREESERNRRVVLCSEADEERVRAATGSMLLGGFLDVRVSDLAPPGQVIVANPSAFDFGPMMAGIPPAALALGAGMGLGIAPTWAREAVETERLTLAIRAVCPREHLEEALAEATRRPVENGLQSVYDDLVRGWLPASTGAAKQQVAPPNPQVGFLGRAFHWLFGRTS